MIDIRTKKDLKEFPVLEDPMIRIYIFLNERVKIMDRFGETVKFKVNADNMNKVRETFKIVYDALEVKGYNPVNQIVAYIMSGDPSYITAHNGARTLIQRLETDEILEELVEFYVSQ